MMYVLKPEDANKVIKIENSIGVVVPEGFPVGTVFIMFNNSDSFITIESKQMTTYVSARQKPRTHIEFPPRGMVNVIIVDEKTAVVSGDAS
ncbi:hypothetical protein EBZ39_14995 [bacterium]|nr:hypothetical protein [bacterium]